MELTTAVDFARSTRQSVFVTIRADGRPQLSNVFHGVSDDDVIRISTTATRAKHRNIVREPWSALHVTRDDFFAYAVLEGRSEVSPVAEHPDDPTVEELVALYRSLAGEHNDWTAYRDAMVSEQRVVIRFSASRAYGMAPGPPASGT